MHIILVEVTVRAMGHIIPVEYMEVHVGFSTVEQTLEYLMHFLHNGLESSYSYVDLILHLGTRTILVWILILVIFMPVGIHRE